MIRTLVLTKLYPHRASYYDDWLDAFARAPQFKADTFNIMQLGAARKLTRIIKGYELIVLLHACTSDAMGTILPLAPVLQERKGKLLAFVGNEGNLPDSPFSRKIAFLQDIRADVIASYLLQETAQWLYAGCTGKAVSIPHALNPDAFYPAKSLASRPIDLGTRTSRYLPYVGDKDRLAIMEYFEQHAQHPPLRLDFDDVQRFDRTGWNVFLNHCRGVVSTESGSRFLDKDDTLVMNIRQYVLSKRKGIALSGDSQVSRLASRLPYPVKATIWKMLRHGPITHAAVADGDLDYNEIFERFFRNAAPCPYYSKVISSRHFDAIGARTVQIMFPGRFNDILKADTHYIALEPDFSNIVDVMQRFRDDAYVTRMAKEAHAYVMSAHTYAHRMQVVYDLFK